MIKVQVSIYDTQESEYLVSPFKLTAHVDYDFVNPTALKNIEFTDRQGEKRSVLQYSLGQLDSEEGAKIESAQPLNQQIAQKIVRALSNI